jgi:hypothetical protein
MAPRALTQLTGSTRVYIPRAGTIKVAEIFNYSGTKGTDEDISIYVRLNGTTDYLVATVGESTSERRFTNASLDIAVVVGDYFEMKLVCPTWETNPVQFITGGYVYIQES